MTIWTIKFSKFSFKVVIQNSWFKVDPKWVAKSEIVNFRFIFREEVGRKHIEITDYNHCRSLALASGTNLSPVVSD